VSTDRGATVEGVLIRRNTEGNAGLVEPEQLADEAAEGTLTLVTAGDAETPVDATESTEAPWADRFASAEAMWEAFQNVDRLRGRLANEVGELRRENDELRAGLDLGEGDALADAGQPPNLAALLAEIDTRFIGQLETLALSLAEAVDARVGPLERKVDAVVARLRQMGGPDA
jgi:hypothetical protein